MKYNLIVFYLTIFIAFVFALGQNIALEQECSILNTLVSLEARLKTLENLEEKTTESLEAKTKQLETLQDKITRFENQEKGTTYTRWGRTSCPGNGSELLYAGYAGGSFFTDSGAAADYLCLPTDPEFAQFVDQQTNGGLVYGAEYQMDGRSNYMEFFPNVDPSTPLYQNNVPCAVCTTPRSTVLMIPARQSCHMGWNLEYKGYLMSGQQGHVAASQYVCLDDEPEIIPDGSANENGKLFYFVEGRCGSLKCPPYVNGRELTCAICSK